MLAISGSTVVAAYAAGVATIVGLRQILVDRPSVLVTVQEDVHIIVPGTLAMRPAFSVTVTNGGRRPVHIDQVWILERGGGMSLPSLWINEFPVILNEGESKTLHYYRDLVGSDQIPRNPRLVALDSLRRVWPRRRRLRMLGRKVRQRLSASKPGGSRCSDHAEGFSHLPANRAIPGAPPAHLGYRFGPASGEPSDRGRLGLFVSLGVPERPGDRVLMYPLPEAADLGVPYLSQEPLTSFLALNESRILDDLTALDAGMSPTTLFDGGIPTAATSRPEGSS